MNATPSAPRTYLMLGGTGTISTGCVEYLRHTHQVTCMNRGSRPLPEGVEQLICDVNDEAAVARVMDGRYYDVVVDFLTFTPEQAEMRIRHFLGKCGRFVFISTAMTYEKPPRTLFVSETTPQGNPFSPYATNKIACEQRFRRAMAEKGLPLTIIRPSYTYGVHDVPFVLRPRGKAYSLVQRFRAGKPILVPGDGNIFWTITHNSDFARALAGLMDNPDTLGEDFHLTTDECMTWDAFCRVIAEAAGAPEPTIVHVATDVLAREDPSLVEALIGDKSQTAVFDNSKLRRFLPGFEYRMSFAEGVKKSIDTLDADPALQVVDSEWDAWCDEMIRRFG